jgi:hypothetical protein
MNAVPSRTSTRRPPTRLGIAGACVTAAGLALVAIGTFLPWVRSGAVLRDSYQSIAAIRALDALDGPLELVLDAWTLVVPIITACAAVYALGLHRVAATISTILAILCGTIATVATVVSSGENVHLGIAGTGPITTMIGSAVAVVGVFGILAGQRRGVTGDAGGEP